MGFLGGIMVIATIAEMVLRGSRHSSSSSGKSGKGSGQIALIAFLLLIIGYAGVMIGRLIQSAVCRQREYLADASAVQFTRSTGIAEALKKIGGFSSGSKIKAPGAGEACHMFISKAVSSLFATHPPLTDRIRRIDPAFSGDFSDSKPLSSAAVTGEENPLSSFQSGQTITIGAGAALKQAGRISPENVAYSATVLAAIPEPVKQETRDILGASALVCALLLSRDPVERRKQMDLLSRTSPPPFLRQLEKVDPYARDIAPGLRLPVLDMAIPALRQMSPEQFAVFHDHIQALIESDSRVTVFEFAFREIITHRLAAFFVATAPKVLYKNITPLTEDAVTLLSFLARSGHKDREAAEKAFRAAVSVLPIRGKEAVMPEKTAFQALHAALERFSRASAGVKKTIFDACCQCILFDGRTSIDEAELLRAVAYAMDIPLPPFITNP
jgi:hypothetical protein